MTTEQRRVRMLDVAQATGLSRATVSLVMQDSPRISAATKRTVLAAADGLGYVYHRGAASLRTQRSDVVGLVMPDIVNPFVAEVSLGAQEVLAEHGYFVVIANTQDRKAEQGHIIRTLIEQPVAGLITIPVLTTDAEQVEMLANAGRPVVILTRELPGSGLPFVGPDDAAIGRIGARHLVADHHCGSVAYFGGNATARPRVLRRRSFAGSAGRRAEVRTDWSAAFDAEPGAAYQTAMGLLERCSPPDGVLCHSDQVAYGLLRALADHKITPQQCRVVGIDDLDQSAGRIPSVSSIAVHPVELGRVAGRHLLAALGDVEESDTTVSVPAPVLLPRESCGC